MLLLGFSNPFPFTKSLSFVFIPLLKLALQVGLPLVEVLVCPVGPLIFLSRFSDHFLLSLINFAVIALLSFARSTQSIRLQKGVRIESRVGKRLTLDLNLLLGLVGPGSSVWIRFQVETQHVEWRM